MSGRVVFQMTPANKSTKQISDSRDARPRVSLPEIGKRVAVHISAPRDGAHCAMVSKQYNATCGIWFEKQLHVGPVSSPLYSIIWPSGVVSLRHPYSISPSAFNKVFAALGADFSPC